MAGFVLEDGSEGVLFSRWGGAVDVGWEVCVVEVAFWSGTFVPAEIQHHEVESLQLLLPYGPEDVGLTR